MDLEKCRSQSGTSYDKVSKGEFLPHQKKDLTKIDISGKMVM
jgi:hypothetical protein